MKNALTAIFRAVPPKYRKQVYGYVAAAGAMANLALLVFHSPSPLVFQILTGVATVSSTMAAINTEVEGS